MADPTEPTNNGGTPTDPPAGDPPQGTPPPAGDPPAGDPPAGDPPKAEGAPETYEFKAPEGQEFDGEFLKVYSEAAKELNLTQDKAQGLIDKLGPVIQQRQMAKISEVQQQWMTDSKADKEFGGEKLEENLGIAKGALEKFGTPELKELLNTSGIGNHPEVIRFFYRAGKALVPDTFVGGHKEGKPSAKSWNDLADTLYGGK